jgi:hypothetical protein
MITMLSTANVTAAANVILTVAVTATAIVIVTETVTEIYVVFYRVATWTSIAGKGDIQTYYWHHRL